MSTNQLVRDITTSNETDELFRRRSYLLQEKISAHPVEIVLWEATRSCNLNCIHCGTPADNIDRSNELTKDEVLRVFKQIKAEFDTSAIKYVSITGGEPTSRKDLPEIVSEIRAIGFQEIAMHSNGHKIAEESGYLETLIESGIGGIGINLDGLEQTHNRIRNHKDAYRLANQACVNIITHRDKLDTMISTVVTRENLGELPRLRDRIFELNPDRWRLIPLEPIGRVPENMPESTLTCDEMAQLIDFILETRAMAEESPELAKAEMSCGQWVGMSLEGLVRPYIWHCIAGINTLGILYDGSIAACSNIHLHFSEGNVRNDNIREVWEKRFERHRFFEWKRNGECIDCSDWDLCHGGDMHRRLPDGSMIGKCFFRWLQEKHVKIINK